MGPGGQHGDGHEEPGQQPDGGVERVGQRVRVAQQDEGGGEQETGHAEREDAHGDGGQEEQRVREVERHVEEQDAPAGPSRPWRTCR